MMTYLHWMQQTKRGPSHPRSKKLKAIDKALQAFEQAKKTNKSTVKALLNLFNALLEWIKSKGPEWRYSIRNSKLEPGGKGTVETLLLEVLALNPAFRITAGPYLTVTAPRTPVMEHGAINRHKDEDGRWYEVPVQSKENSCGPTCIRIVIKLVNNKDVSEEYLRELVEFVEEGGGYSGSLGTTGVLIGGGAHNWDPGGGGTWLIPGALGSVRPAIKATLVTNPNVLLTTAQKKPAIAVVAWTAGGLHYIVVAGKNSAGNKLVILDPFYGLQYVSVAGSTMANYEPKNSSGVALASSTWYPWVCKVD